MAKFGLPAWQLRLLADDFELTETNFRVDGALRHTKMLSEALRGPKGSSPTEVDITVIVEDAQRRLPDCRAALQRAVQSGSLSNLALLVRCGCSVNLDLAPEDSFLGSKPKSALHAAVLSGKLEVCEALVAYRADIEAKNQLKLGGQTVLQQAASRDKLDLCQLFISQGADPNAKHSVGAGTALHDAAREGHYEICRLLLNSSADLAAQDVFGMTPLHWTHWMRNIREELRPEKERCAQLLLACRADQIARSGGGHTPVEIQDPEIAEQMTLWIMHSERP
eukprot:CAMPEP_0197689446 /NCGR_PEP_ID=MMETSP1338-20131121/106849_1 /TAXON_ID=43686 ORGANISM="Pelagodinium beii, Strain RCC1491" /NCGR_SAMPLE_ID=MMETSP1338 /ASSEMBLY_ACC=CAM_ASM_000754 /LENGTH=279 /DNA_ID=CAMNT_0043271779 /DNA_START=64 /DNA_END=900 /DNA_ORIENTATION=-